MDELLNIKKAVKPQEILLVVDSMTGQDAVNVAQSFNEKLGVDGIILTKLMVIQEVELLYQLKLLQENR